MQTMFSVDMCDRDGDVIEAGIFIHIENTTILKFKDTVELEDFARGLLSMIAEIKENYPEHADD